MIRRFLSFSLIVAGSFLFFVIFFLTAKSLLPVLPDMTLFRQIEFDFHVGVHAIPFFDVFFFAAGLFIFCYGIVVLIDVTEYNSSAIDPITRVTRVLLTQSYYADARHPMSGALMLVEIGLFISVRSLYGLVFIAAAVFVQALFCIIEERFLLKKLFGAEYEEYRKKVRSFVMTLPMKVIVSVVLIAVLAGIYFMGPRR